MSTSYDVIIVGAGLAGLRAAQVLENAGRSVLVLEARAEVGGRVASRTVDGFVLDEGFQLINPSYPELVATGVLDGFDLRRFESALTLVKDGRSVAVADPRRSPVVAIMALAKGAIGLHDARRAALLFARCGLGPVSSFLGGPDSTTRSGLEHNGFSAHAIDDLFQPFLRGTMLDDELSTSWRYGQLLLRSFFKGRPGTHPRGIAALPKAMATRLSATTIHLDEAVETVTSNRVTTERGEYRARNVLVATDATDARGLVGGDEHEWRAQTTWWFALPKLDGPGRLRLDLDRRFISSALDISSVAPERSPAGTSLVGVPANGTFTSSEHDRRVVEDVCRLYEVTTTEVALVDKCVVVRALPVVATPLDLRPPFQRGGVVLAGDYLQTPSIQGALVSGRRAASAVLRG